MSRIAVKGLNVPEQDLKRVADALSKSPSGELPAFVGGSKGDYFVEIDVGTDRLRFPAATVIVERKLEEFPEAHILDVCNLYYASLELLVRQCHEKFDA